MQILDKLAFNEYDPARAVGHSETYSIYVLAAGEVYPAAGDMAVYAGVRQGQPTDRDYELVAAHGRKLNYRQAKGVFPSLTEADYRA